LDEQEQSQVVEHIQQLEDKEQSKASFYVLAFNHRDMNSFEVKAQEDSYTVAYDGKVIEVLKHNKEWRQFCEEQLEEDVFVSIKQAIEAKFE
jgi:hypothetical protein